MGNPFLAEIRLVSFTFAPKGWAFCNGQLLPISQNTALFSLLGTTYGGNGVNTFALPDLRGRIPLHFGAGLFLGQSGGEERHTLITAELPAHTHPVIGSSMPASTPNPSNAFWASTAAAAYSNSPNTSMLPQSLGLVGGGQAHENRAPFLALNFIIALQGIFPSRP